MADQNSIGKIKNKFKPQFSSELNIESLISAPLIAASKANVTMVTGQARFILDFCFTKNTETNTYEPIMITMSLTKGVIDSNVKPGESGYIKSETINFDIPLLTIIPLNSLAVNKVNIDFDLEITSVASYSDNSENKIMRKQAVLNGKIGSNSSDTNSSVKNQYQSKSSSKLKVNVSAGPLPLPNGLLSILDIYTKAIQPSHITEK